MYSQHIEIIPDTIIVPDKNNQDKNNQEKKYWFEESLNDEAPDLEKYRNIATNGDISVISQISSPIPLYFIKKYMGINQDTIKVFEILENEPVYKLDVDEIQLVATLPFFHKGTIYQKILHSGIRQLKMNDMNTAVLSFKCSNNKIENYMIVQEPIDILDTMHESNLFNRSLINLINEQTDACQKYARKLAAEGRECELWQLCCMINTDNWDTNWDDSKVNVAVCVMNAKNFELLDSISIDEISSFWRGRWVKNEYTHHVIQTKNKSRLIELYEGCYINFTKLKLTIDQFIWVCETLKKGLLEWMPECWNKETINYHISVWSDSNQTLVNEIANTLEYNPDILIYVIDKTGILPDASRFNNLYKFAFEKYWEDSRYLKMLIYPMEKIREIMQNWVIPREFINLLPVNIRGNMFQIFK